MNLLSRLLHLLLCLALVAGGPGVAGLGVAHAMPGGEAQVEMAGSCHDAMADDTTSGPDEAPAAPTAPDRSGDGCCDDGACPCPGVASFALALPTRENAALPLQADAPPALDAAARGPPPPGSTLRPPIG